MGEDTVGVLNRTSKEEKEEWINKRKVLDVCSRYRRLKLNRDKDQEESTMLEL